MRVSVFGLGYVGAVTIACLARDGHTVIGVDVNPDKVALVAAGRSPIVEPGLPELLAAGAARGRVIATDDHRWAVAHSGVSLVCVGTPPLASGAPDLTHVTAVCREIGAAVRAKDEAHVVVLRSTVPPGTTARCRLLLRAAATPVPVHVAFNPEFLREGSAIADFDHPPYTVIGATERAAADAVAAIYASVEGEVCVVAPRTVELLKWVANTWHATKIAFANEIGRLARASDVDGEELMALIARDTKLNSSPAYLRPGFAYGGSCLPKDVAALLSHAAEACCRLPLLESLPVSNRAHIEAVGDLLLEQLRSARAAAADAAASSASEAGGGALAVAGDRGARRRRLPRVAVLGLAFKHGTDDLRESPSVVLVKRLIGEGCDVRIYDRDVRQARLMGTNLAYIRANLPHFEALLVDDPASALAEADAVVIANAADEFAAAVGGAADGRATPLPVVDLAGLLRRPPANVALHAPAGPSRPACVSKGRRARPVAARAAEDGSLVPAA
jgi:GDP-mannose 6-dehydrogenase